MDDPFVVKAIDRLIAINPVARERAAIQQAITKLDPGLVVAIAEAHQNPNIHKKVARASIDIVVELEKANGQYMAP